MRRWHVAVLALLLVGATVAGTAAWWIHHRAVQRARDRAEAVAVATRFVRAWQAKDYALMGRLTAADPDAGASFQRLEQRLQVSSLSVGVAPPTGDGTRVRYTVTAVLKGLGSLSWEAQVETVRTRAGRRVAFRSSTVFPGLQNGQVLTRSQPVVTRGAITDRYGVPIRGRSADLAANVLGSAGAVKTGLERVFDEQLTGSSGGDVEVVDRATGAVVRVVKHFPPHAAEPVRTTLDLSVQRAAEDALAAVPGQAALVALDAATGEVRAVANKPVAGLPAAFRDEAPGSTFKVVVAAAALAHGYTPATRVSCPEHAVFGGKSFGNDEPLPASMTLAQAFARSCNTAFLTIADGFPKGTVRATAQSFGFGLGNLLPIGVQGGQVPVPSSTSEAYADVIGQGRVEASPLLLAAMSAAVASGAWHQPQLVPGQVGTTHPVAHAVELRALMRAVVVSGTAARAGLPAGTAGKTGTAQYGTGLPLRTHAWFTGFRGGLAFCVYVKDGSSGGEVAAPVAARFLRALP